MHAKRRRQSGGEALTIGTTARCSNQTTARWQVLRRQFRRLKGPIIAHAHGTKNRGTNQHLLELGKSRLINGKSACALAHDVHDAAYSDEDYGHYAPDCVRDAAHI